MIEWLQHILKCLLHFDEELFFVIHSEWSNSFFDLVVPPLRNKYFWIPLYLFWIFMAWRRYGLKVVWIVLLGALTVLLADQLSAGLIKPLVERPRPCNDPCIHTIVQPKVSCGSGFSFVSSHASNHFALAMFFTWVFLKRSNRFWLPPLLMFWALSISFAQVYVGVHYPLDVICGGILGLIIGWGIAKLKTLLLSFRAGKRI